MKPKPTWNYAGELRTWPAGSWNNMTLEQLGEIAYREYWKSIVIPNAYVPKWRELPETTRRAWERVAATIRANALSGFTRVGEGERP